jgi:hypothetical protein
MCTSTYEHVYHMGWKDQGAVSLVYLSCSLLTALVLHFAASR